MAEQLGGSPPARWCSARGGRAAPVPAPRTSLPGPKWTHRQLTGNPSAPALSPLSPAPPPQDVVSMDHRGPEVEAASARRIALLAGQFKAGEEAGSGKPVRCARCARWAPPAAHYSVPRALCCGTLGGALSAGRAWAVKRASHKGVRLAIAPTPRLLLVLTPAPTPPRPAPPPWCTAGAAGGRCRCQSDGGGEQRAGVPQHAARRVLAAAAARVEAAVAGPHPTGAARWPRVRAAGVWTGGEAAGKRAGRQAGVKTSGQGAAGAA